MPFTPYCDSVWSAFPIAASLIQDHARCILCTTLAIMAFLLPSYLNFCLLPQSTCGHEEQQHTWPICKSCELKCHPLILERNSFGTHNRFALVPSRSQFPTTFWIVCPPSQGTFVRCIPRHEYRPAIRVHALRSLLCGLIKWCSICQAVIGACSITQCCAVAFR